MIPQSNLVRLMDHSLALKQVKLAYNTKKNGAQSRNIMVMTDSLSQKPVVKKLPNYSDRQLKVLYSLR